MAIVVILFYLVEKLNLILGTFNGRYQELVDSFRLLVSVFYLTTDMFLPTLQVSHPLFLDWDLTIREISLYLYLQ